MYRSHGFKTNGDRFLFWPWKFRHFFCKAYSKAFNLVGRTVRSFLSRSAQHFRDVFIAPKDFRSGRTNQVQHAHAGNIGAGSMPFKTGRTAAAATLASQRGIAAVEFAVIAPILLVSLAFPLFFGRVFWHYTVAQKAAHNAAVYLASVPNLDMLDGKRQVGMMELARDMIDDGMVGFNPQGYDIPTVDISCDNRPCGNSVIPAAVRVIIRVRMNDDIFDAITWVVTGDDGLLITADVTMPYVGR